tara:strand:+ start:33648 stop:34748 length:1101 start_codon:yes stop_codon:yes gene_type:complete
VNYSITGNWTALSVVTGIAVGLPVVLTNAGRAGDLLEVVISDTEPLASDRGVPIKALDAQYTVSGQSQEAWMRYVRYDLNGTITPSPARTCLLSVQDSAFVQESRAIPSDLMTNNVLGKRGIKVSNQPLELLISKGLIAGHRMIYVNSYANTITTTTKLIWPFASQYVISDTPTSFWLSSTNASDTNNILIQTLDADYNEQNFVIALNGQVPVEFSAGVGLRINKIRCVSPIGTLGNVYAARANAHTGGVPNDTDMIVSAFEASKQTSNLALFSVPAGHTLFGQVGYFSAPKGRDNDFYWNARNPSASIPPTVTNVVSVYQDTVQIDFAMTPIPEKTDAFFSSSTTASNGRVSCRVVGILVNNDFL